MHSRRFRVRGIIASEFRRRRINVASPRRRDISELINARLATYARIIWKLQLMLRIALNGMIRILSHHARARVEILDKGLKCATAF